MMKSKYIVGALAAFALLAAVSQLRSCAGVGSHQSPKYNSAQPVPGATVPAPASTAPAPPMRPPLNVVVGYAERRVTGQDQYGQWQTLSAATVPLDTLDVTVDALPKGTAGKRRTEYTAWIRTDQPTSQVLLHAVGYTAQVAVQIDDWRSPVLRHDNSWTAAPSTGRYVVTLPAGWHRVVLSVTRQRGFTDGPVSVRLQLGAADLDPIVPMPYAVPASDSPTPATSGSTSAPAAASTTAPAPAATTGGSDAG